MSLAFLSVFALLLAGDAAADATARRAALTEDTRGRPVIEARLNGHPVPMVVDTAAQTSFVTASLADEIGLPELDERMTIDAAAGRADVALVAVDHFSTPLFDSENVSLLTLPNAGVTEARGIIGMEMFTEGRLVFDNLAGVLSLEDSAPAPAGFETVKGRLDESGLLIVPVTINGIEFDALVDSGAAVTVADGAGLAALGWEPNDARLRPLGQITGATSHGTEAHFGQIDRLSLGPITFRDIALVFTGGGDQPAAESSPPQRPTLILGANLLRALDAYAVDFSRAELQLRP